MEEQIKKQISSEFDILTDKVYAHLYWSIKMLSHLNNALTPLTPFMYTACVLFLLKTNQNKQMKILILELILIFI